ENCGAEVGEEKEKSIQNSTQFISLGIIKGEDGVLRWVYEMNMWKNPTLLITIWKVLLLAAFVPAILMVFLSLGDGTGSALFTFIKIYALVAVIITGLMLLAYPLVAFLNGGIYSVVFEMDDRGIKHIQMQKQFKKNQILSLVTILAGLASGNLQTASAGILAGTKQSSYSQFSKVKSITVNTKRKVINLNETVSHNQVYAYSEDFDFVTAYILSRCKDANMKEK
ncbi:MAG TPA: hypothetical protein VK856_12460, partial [Anaerolineaceae bacterium]|nr:hypothetical protein [Anaerolineaceae bacterium]